MRRILLTLLLLALCHLPGLAQIPSLTPTPTLTPSSTASAGVALTPAAVKKEIEKVKGMLRGQPAGQTAQLLGELESIYRRQVTALGAIDKANQAQQQASQELDQVRSRGLSKPGPYGVDFLDQTRDDLENQRQKQETARLTEQADKQTLALAKTQIRAADQQRIDLGDQLASATDPAVKASLEQQKARAELALRAARQNLVLQQLQLQVAQVDHATAGLVSQTLQAKVALVEQKFHFAHKTLQDKLDQLDSQRGQLNTRLGSAEVKLQDAENRLATLQNQLQNTSGGDQALLQARVDARKAWVATYRSLAQGLQEAMARIDTAKQFWQRRYQVSRGGVSDAKLRRWNAETGNSLDEIGSARRILLSRLRDLHNTLAGLQEQRAGEQPSSPMARVLRTHVQALQKQEDDVEDLLTGLIAVQRLGQRLQQEIQGKRSGVAWTQLLSYWLGKVGGFWNIQLYTIGDRAVTIKKFVMALVVLFLGLWVARRTVGLLRQKLLKRLGLKENVVVSLERLLHYFLTLMVVLFALYVVNIPLTIFTFLGGTLAIAVGFGAQNILNNFISGLILMVERPVKVGDMIEVDDTVGVVEEIGARSTRIRTFTGIHVMVPNSKLLENKVTNWTLRDTKVRTCVQVGVAYGSETRKVIDLIRLAVDKHPQADKFPEPAILFADFGDSSLDFEVHFWLTAETVMQRRMVESEVRLTIDDLFQEHGIEIPFPQRDIHLKGRGAPFDVRVIGSQEE